MDEAAAAIELDVDLAVRHSLLSPPNSFAANSFSARRRQIESSHLFRHEGLTGHTGSIYSMEFSDDGTHLISGGVDKTVRLWSHNQGRDDWDSTELETNHENIICCLAFSPDNQRIFSGGFDKKVLIHDTDT